MAMTMVAVIYGVRVSSTLQVADSQTGRRDTPRFRSRRQAGRGIRLHATDDCSHTTRHTLHAQPAPPALLLYSYMRFPLPLGYKYSPASNPRCQVQGRS